ACPLTCPRCPLSRMVTPYARTKAVRAGREGTVILIPVNNPLERIMKEIRRRTRVVGAFPDGPVLSQPGCSTTALHRRHSLVRQMLHEHAAALSAASPANRSRRLIKCAKESARYPPAEAWWRVPRNICPTLGGSAAWFIFIGTSSATC